MSTDDSARPAGVSVATAGSEEAILAKAGYKPELRRSLRFFSMFAIAFSIISITTGIFLNYGFGLSYWGPASIWTWPIVGVGNMMIALVVAELGTRIPLAGYAYQWSARLVNPTYGWFVGFAGLLYMSVGGGAIMLGVASPLLLSEFNVTSPSPRLVFAVAIILMLLPVIFNIISIQVAARVNNVAVFTEIIGTVVFGVLLFILWALKTKPSPYGASILTNTTATLHNPTIYAFALAGLMGAFTLVGFELAADMSEDAVNPRQSVPRGVLWAVAGSAVLGMIALIGFTVAIPSLRSGGGCETVAAAAADDRRLLAAVLAGQGVHRVRRLLDVRDPGRRRRRAGAAGLLDVARQHAAVLGHAAEGQPSTQTPIIALLVFAVVDIGVTWYGYSADQRVRSRSSARPRSSRTSSTSS